MNLRNWKRIALLGVVAILVIGGSRILGGSKIAAEPIIVHCFTYYADDTFTVKVGAWSTNCDNTITSWGTTSSYRYKLRTNCWHGGTLENCQQSDGQGGWVNIQCPGGMTPPDC
jgi:hypothetical protein